MLWRHYLAYFFDIYPTNRQKRLASFVKRIIGRKPFYIELYELALRHTSAAVHMPGRAFLLSNERLEYLGDAVLGAIVADYLYHRYPFREEGFLTEIRSRVVSRETLNHLGTRLGLLDFIEFGGVKAPGAFRSLVGDALEAFIGAVYLDKGFAFTRRMVIHRLIEPHLDIEHLVQTPHNFKSLLLEWGQRHGKKIRFSVLEVRTSGARRHFTVEVYENDTALAKGQGMSKKEAEQDAARNACLRLALI